jgi:hypothetical protein
MPMPISGHLIFGNLQEWCTPQQACVSGTVAVVVCNSLDIHKTIHLVGAGHPTVFTNSLVAMSVSLTKTAHMAEIEKTLPVNVALSDDVQCGEVKELNDDEDIYIDPARERKLLWKIDSCLVPLLTLGECIEVNRISWI